jgi:hypothetical protein
MAASRLVFDFPCLYTALHAVDDDNVIELPQMIGNAHFMVALPVF